MEQIHYGRKDINVPQSWQEMSAKQLLALARLSAAGVSAQCIKLLFAFHVIGACVLGRYIHTSSWIPQIRPVSQRLHSACREVRLALLRGEGL